MSFALDITKFAKKVDVNLEKVVKTVVINLGTKVIQRNPVGDWTLWNPPKKPIGYVGGRSRSNWHYGFGTMPSKIIDTIDATGGTAITAITNGVNNSPVAGIHWITNSLPYIVPLEDGSSRQAPAGMVKISIAEFGAVVDKAAKDVN